jgi:predicted alpha/beta superfamily hydrolase
VISSRQVGGDLHLRVGHPIPGLFGPGATGPAPPPRVLYVLDGDLYFGAALETTRLMHQLYGELPPLLVVGVSYGTDDPRTQSQLRNRDFTPTSVAQYEQMAGMGGTALPEGQRLGRAAQFLAFLREETHPLVQSHFSIDAKETILFGSSLGGLFALWTSLTAPASFSHYIATSPSIWWDNELLFGLEEQMAANTKDVAARLFLGVGALEERAEIPMLAQFKLITNTTRMAQTLTARGYPSLGIASEVVAGESHTSVVIPSLVRGLRSFFGR